MLVLVACKEKEDPTPWYMEVPAYYMDEDFKAYFAPAGEGSWYVYYDSLRGMYDTLTITSVSKSLGTYAGGMDMEFDYISENYGVSYTSTYKESPSSPTLDWGLSCRTVPPKPIFDYEVAYCMSITGGLPSICASESKGFNLTDYAEVSFVDSVVLQGRVYYDVLKCDQDGLFSPIWFAKGIGPIRRVHSSAYTKDFQLLDYHITPNPMGTTISETRQ